MYYWYFFYRTIEPLGKPFTSISSNLSSLEAQSTIPLDSIPLILAGFKFVTTITFLPIMSSGL